jgi:outer membrane protein assembly factor BamB
MIAAACLIFSGDLMAQKAEKNLEIVFSEKNLSDWNFETGKWEVQKDVLVQAQDGQSAKAVLKNVTVSQGETVSVRLRQMSGRGSYLVLHALNTSKSLYWGINSAGKVRFQGVDVKKDLSYPVKQGQWITLGIELKAQDTCCYINGRLVSREKAFAFPCEIFLYTYLSSAEFDDLKIGTFSPAASQAGKSALVKKSKYFHYQHGISDPGFCDAELCVDFNNDGRRGIVFGSRSNKNLTLINASDGQVIWQKKLKGNSQISTAYDVDGDGYFEIIHSQDDPGSIQLIDRKGNILKTCNPAGILKLGNSPVIIDGDNDGCLEAYLGSRYKKLICLDMKTFTVKKQRSGWSQCGGQTSALDVDKNGTWALFAGTGDDVSTGKGVLHRYDPITLADVWSYKTNDNASSADPVLVDIDGDKRVEIIKSVDNYGHDDAHDAVHAFKTDGTHLWQADGFSGEDSPNVADLDGDGSPEIVGMTFGGEVYCLDAQGKVKWRKDLRPEHQNDAHAYMAPVLCDINGDKNLEVLAVTNGPYNGSEPAVLYALSATGEVLDSFTVKNVTYAGYVFYCNVDGDPFMELVLAGKGGLDLIETKGFGPNTEHFIRKRSYQRNNVVPWAYHDTYFIYRGSKENVVNSTDNLVLASRQNAYSPSGRFVTELLTLPSREFIFDHIDFETDQPEGTSISLNILDADNKVLKKNVKNGPLDINQPVKLEFLFKTGDLNKTPKLDVYTLCFNKKIKGIE